MLLNKETKPNGKETDKENFTKQEIVITKGKRKFEETIEKKARKESLKIKRKLCKIL